MNILPGIWAYAGLKSISLTAAPDSAVEPNVTRPKGIQVWNCAPFDTINVFDYGDGGAPQPVNVAVPRNGVFSGRLVVSSDQAIKGLKVAVSDLAAAEGGGALPASAVTVRYAEAATPAKCWLPAHRFDGLYSVIPAEGLAPVTVPLRVNVSAWTIADPKDFRIQNFAYLSEDALAKYYGAPMWSDRHFALMAKSWALMAEMLREGVQLGEAILFIQRPSMTRKYPGISNNVPTACSTSAAKFS